eukprot:TRINITY_DN10953_c0_g1_i1.p1 TRINITY_DN10953_c0_g1~~TRINITY_DN10953_c0_g1_i1.p1  ORF type:complete len:499 (+),score=192.27 TRINITY_DN10953_c0_g1_i1:89-1585(+)
MAVPQNDVAFDTWSLPDSDEDKQSTHAATLEDEEEEDAEAEEDQRRTTYRTHAKYLYDTLQTTAIDARACTLQSAAELTMNGAVLENRFISGTYGQGRCKQHYIVVYKCCTPNRHAEHYSWSRVNTTTGELGGEAAGPKMELEVEYRLYHEGDVAALRVWDCNPSILATRALEGTDINVFNTTKQLWAKPKPKAPNAKALAISDAVTTPYLKAQKAVAMQDKLRMDEWEEHEGVNTPDLRLTGLAAPGTGLDISPGKEGYVAASTSAGGTLVWRLCDAERGETALAPTSTTLIAPSVGATESDSDFDTALRFNSEQAELLLGVANTDMFLCDVRDPERPRQWRPGGVAGRLLCVDWNIHTPTTFAVGASDGATHVFDVRNATSPVYTFTGHSGDVFSVGWCPHQPSVLATGSGDGTVCLWDIRGRDAGCHPVADVDKCPKELFFKHDGHSYGETEIGAVAWCRNEELKGLVASIDMDPSAPELHVWRPRNSFWVDTSG